MSSTGDRGGGVSRRAVLLGALALSTPAALASCGLRVEWPGDSGTGAAPGSRGASTSISGGPQGEGTRGGSGTSAPVDPGAGPTREATRQALIGAAGLVNTLLFSAERQAATKPGAKATPAQLDAIRMAGRLAGVHRAQATVLEARLSAMGTALGASGSRPRSAGLAALESQGLAGSDVAALLAVEPADATLLAALMVQRSVAARLLGGQLPTWVGTGYLRADAARLLAASRSAAYGLGVVAGRVDAAHRTVARSALSVLSTRVHDLEESLGTDAPAPALGYRLPAAIRTPTDAAALGRTVLDRLAEVVLAGVATALADGAPEDRIGHLTTLLGWLTELENAAVALGRPPSAMPGMRVEDPS